jgi:membrane protease YdiL (CAAX protease family)
MVNRQQKMIRQMSAREILFHLYVTQVILLVIAIGLGFFLFADVAHVKALWKPNFQQILLYGVGSALIVILIDGFLMMVLPKEMYHDGGINEKVFENTAAWHIFIIAGVVAFTEELLFRGVLQTHFGILFASIVFAILHLRYLHKWLLFTMVVIVSFFLGWLFLITENLWVTIVSHFLIDFVFAMLIRRNYVKRVSAGIEKG